MPLALDAIEAATDGCLPTAARAQPRQRRPAAGRAGRRGRVPPSCAGHRRSPRPSLWAVHSRRPVPPHPSSRALLAAGRGAPSPPPGLRCSQTRQADTCAVAVPAR